MYGWIGARELNRDSKRGLASRCSSCALDPVLCCAPPSPPPPLDRLVNYYNILLTTYPTSSTLLTISSALNLISSLHPSSFSFFSCCTHTIPYDTPLYTQSITHHACRYCRKGKLATYAATLPPPLPPPTSVLLHYTHLRPSAFSHPFTFISPINLHREKKDSTRSNRQTTS
ncbi:hypothetical protein DM02DRAFT_315813 [Periconia macrospinosa]|uniref:Uncharacterized protein n=1 Tax=Periconia macrospinosa TaxID=97972 RepID=A0A2V1D193_9PLEO|nr:hypothetical protein DM02DRAFT_315813 [Periconia macrospinosa]